MARAKETMRRKNVAMSSLASRPAQNIEAGMRPGSAARGTNDVAKCSWMARIVAVFVGLAGLKAWYSHGHGNPASASSAAASDASDSRQTNTKKRAEMGRLAFGTNKHWDKTAANVVQAIDSGYHHIATAGRHMNYNEEAVGEGIRQALKESQTVSSREELFLQTCFVSNSNPDYDKNWSPGTISDTATSELSNAEQVRLSVESSLKNLNTTYLDAVLYHNLKSKLDSYDQIREVWTEMEKLVDEGTIRYLGLTNVHDLNFLERFYDEVRIKPTILQNRFHSNRQFNVPLRSFIQKHNIRWQAFWVLTGNGGTIGGSVSKDLAKKYEVTPQQVIFAFVLSLGATPMIGSASPQHLKQDMDITGELLSQEDRIRFAGALGNPDLIEK